MKNAEFVALLTANTNKTESIRTYGNKWFSGARRVDDETLCRIGHVISLIQAMIDKGLIINKETEALLVYNFQPILVDGTETCHKLYLSLDMMIKPISQLNDTHKLVGTPLQMVVEAKSGEVMNNTKAMLEISLILPEDLSEDDPPACSYGHASEYTALACFAPLPSHTFMPANDIFEGRFDHSEVMTNVTAYDSFTQAHDHLQEHKMPGWVAEFRICKEKISTFVAKGLGSHVLKLMDMEKAIVIDNPNPDREVSEDRVDDEIRFLHDAMEEAPLSDQEKISHPDNFE